MYIVPTVPVDIIGLRNAAIHTSGATSYSLFTLATISEPKCAVVSVSSTVSDTASPTITSTPLSTLSISSSVALVNEALPLSPNKNFSNFAPPKPILKAVSTPAVIEFLNAKSSAIILDMAFISSGWYKGTSTGSSFTYVVYVCFDNSLKDSL